MTLEQLTPIIQQADEKAIAAELKKLGYIDCKKDKALKKLNVIDLFNGDEQQSEDFIDSKHKFVYDGCITHNVKGFERYEFITVTICKIRKTADPFEDEEAIQYKVLFYAKEII